MALAPGGLRMGDGVRVDRLDLLRRRYPRPGRLARCLPEDTVGAGDSADRDMDDGDRVMPSVRDGDLAANKR